tara:strand:- start:1388 stop:2563 length:1176 start_codon:yes stop_codon:yes gene_type:complete
MKYWLSFILIVSLIDASFSQNLDSLYIQKINDTITSKFLNSERVIQLQLPRSYNIKEKKKYPLILVLDGDYLFNLVSGSVDFLSYWKEIPESIVIGIKQKKTRYDDSSVLDNSAFTPISSTASFYDFISNELIPQISKEYKVNDFKILIGHERTANFANFFILKKNPKIRGVISISPKLSVNMQRYLTEYFSNSNSKIAYTISSSKMDFESIFMGVESLSKSLDSIDNKNLLFNPIMFENENFYTLPSLSIPLSIKKTFSLYTDIYKAEYDSIISQLDSSPIEYLKNKYKLIEEFYDVDKQISKNDFDAIEKYIQANDQYELYDELFKLAVQEHPGTILPSYYKGRYFEGIGEFKKAIGTYRSAYNMNDLEGLTKNDLQTLADEIEADSNY